MVPNRPRFLKYVARIFDLCVLTISIVAALIATFPPKGIMLAGFLAMRIKLGNCLLFVLLLALWHQLFISCGLYVSKRLTTQRGQVLEVCKASTLAALLLFLAAKAFHLESVRPSFVLVFCLSCTLMMVAGRIGARAVLIALRSRGRNRRFMLIVGTNERAIAFGDQLNSHPELGYEIVGFVDDDWPGILDFESTGHTRCCVFLGLPEFLRRNVVDEVAIYLPLKSYYEHAAELVSICEQHGIVLRFDSQVFNLKKLRANDQEFEEHFQPFALAGSTELVPAVIKRTLDCLFSSALLAILALPMLVVAILVKMTSPGSVFFRQTRVGLNKLQFTIYKFRTMVENAERLQEELLSMNEMTGPVFKITKDPRITPLGRILRKTSIDELPQLVNVLKGDMSLVGPRAMSLRDYQRFDQDWQRRRFSVKPGITCLWQIRGRNSVPFQKWMELDMQYIDEWSLWLDLTILVRTVPAVLRGTGAA
jgi:exopolysaccharide biosynthesis polyprenyl glycosylphosphotransferase